jgi:hypothetical protein
MILRPRRLADALAANALSEREKFHYLVLWAVVGTLLGAGVGAGDAWTRPRLASLALLAIITVVGLIICFRANARGDNQAFLERYVCLSALIGLVSSALYYALYYGMGVVALIGGWIDRDARGWNRDAMGLAAWVLASVVYYLWLRQLLTRAARVRTSA